ncbi:cytochrome D1 domain-containing protein [Caldimonas tepidiphila]|uniref:cytochrome D1 domain-containing protein n=1 Tax=Caldimonas tepidiphila TaxID=2315841 RepID=UPI000E5AC7D3|nr:cytochrome D1 domain-containing protein [Caldimonas tepidiphila]
MRHSLALVLGLALCGPAAAGDGPAPAGQVLRRNGIVVEFDAHAAGSGAVPTEGRIAELRFRIRDEGSGQPLRGLAPSAWMDIAAAPGDTGAAGAAGGAGRDCRERVSLYLKGAVGMRAAADLNGYSLLLLDREPGVTVVEPQVSVGGSTSTYTTIALKRPGIDWARSADTRTVFVSMPQAGEVAAIDTDGFTLKASLPAGPRPTRLALQPDGRFLWVGNNATRAEDSGVTVIDTRTLERVARIATGAGHHEIAFSADARLAFVSNRDAGTVAVIDAGRRRLLRRIATGPLPISLAYSPLSHALYVADAKEGVVSVIDARSLKLVKRIRARPGLGPLRLTPDSRWAFALNPAADEVSVIDVAGNEVVHTLKVAAQPYQASFTAAYAYLRALGSERVTMVKLSTLGAGREPLVQSFAAGAAAPAQAGPLAIADGIAPAGAGTGVFVVNPAEQTTYFYMEGMNAPSSQYRSRGASARAVMAVDRGLKETAPGVYAATLRLPAAGRYDVAFLLDSPRLLHCFSAEVRPDPSRPRDAGPLRLEHLLDGREVATGMLPLRLRLLDPATGAPRTGLRDVTVSHFLAPGRQRREVPAREVGDGVYEAALALSGEGAYYIHVAVPSLGVGYRELPLLTLRARRPAGDAAAGRPASPG